MDYYIVIPIHNEEAFLESTLNSILNQTLLPKKVILVNDNSSDNTETIIDSFSSKHTIFQKLNIISSTQHMPGSKVINAFNKGFNLLDESFDFIVKLDADIILPKNYFEVISTHFKKEPNLGICGGFIYEQNESGDWILNHPMDKNHVRGAFKAYTRVCFKAIGGLKNAMGWDTVDELLARFHSFLIQTDPTLKIKHLRPTGKAYNKNAKRLQGKAMYSMRYGFLITCIASLKMAAEKNDPYLVNEEEGKFIRQLRWTNIKRKLYVQKKPSN